MPGTSRPGADGQPDRECCECDPATVSVADAQPDAGADTVRDTTVTAVVRDAPGIAPLPPVCARDGAVSAVYGYHDDVHPAVCQIPGSPSGATVTLLRSWEAVEVALARDQRDLSAAQPDDALTGVGREDKYGLERLGLEDSRAMRAVLNPVFSPSAVARWDDALAAAAYRHAAAAARGSGRGDLIAGYLTPLLESLAEITAGLGKDEWAELQVLVDGAAGLITSPGDHVATDAARVRFHTFAAEVTRARREDRRPAQDLAGVCARVMAEKKVPDDRAIPAMMNILLGWPSAGPATAMLLLEILAQEEAVVAACADPTADTARDALREAIRRSAHFAWVAPGPLSGPLRAGDLTLPAGTLVLPLIHAACLDPAYAGEEDPHLFRLGRRRRPVLAFGAGTHRCPAYSLMIRFQALAVAAAVDAGLRLAADPSDIPLRGALMPVPAEIPVRRAGRPRG